MSPLASPHIPEECSTPVDTQQQQVVAYGEITEDPTPGKRAQNRDPYTGRILKKVRPDIEESARTIDVPVKAAPLPESNKLPNAIRVWTGGPGTVQEKITLPGSVGSGIRPYRDYAYYCKTQDEVAALKRALGGKFWIDTVPDDEPAPRCDTCGWECRSYAAAMFHANHAHGRLQE